MGLITPEDRIDDLCQSYNGSAASRLGGWFIELADPLHMAHTIEPVDQVLAYALNMAAAIRALQEAKRIAPDVVKNNTTGSGGEKWKHVASLMADLHPILTGILEKPN